MRRAYKTGLATIAAAAVFGFGALLYAMVSKPDVHPLNESCAGCHMAGTETTQANASMLIASQEKLCGKCHASAMNMSHPSGFKPSPGYNFPPDYPRDWKGDLTCSTCHEVHSDVKGKLRGTVTGREMCVSCHNQDFFAKMLDGGNSVLASGHMSKSNPQHWPTLDAYSVKCLECHLEDVQVDSNLKVMIVRHGAQNHPVGTSYAAAESFGGYKPMSTLPRKIRLPGGMLSCVSCHESFTKNHGKVIITGNPMAICFECHDLF